MDKSDKEIREEIREEIRQAMKKAAEKVAERLVSGIRLRGKYGMSLPEILNRKN